MIAISFVSAIFKSRCEFSITFAASAILMGFGFVGTRSNYLFVETINHVANKDCRTRSHFNYVCQPMSPITGVNSLWTIAAKNVPPSSIGH